MDMSKERAAPEEKPPSQKHPQKTFLDALGGEPLAGSGFEQEEPEPGFAETRRYRPAPGQNPA